MESGRADRLTSSAAAASAPSDCSHGAPLHTSKLTCLRRYVTDRAARSLLNKSAAGDSQRPHDSEQPRARRRRVGGRVDSGGITREESRVRNPSGFHLLHDALGEAEGSPPRVAVKRCSAAGLPSGSTSRRAAASFDALQFGRVQCPRAGGKAEAYSLASKEDRYLNFSCAPSDGELHMDTFAQDEKLCDSTDSDDGEVVVVDDTGQNVRFDASQQRQVKALLKAEEQGLQPKQCTGHGPAQTDTEARNTVSPARARSPSLSPGHPLSAAVDATRRALSSPDGATRLLCKTQDAVTEVDKLKESKLGTKHTETETARQADASNEVRKDGGRRRTHEIERDSSGDLKFSGEERDNQGGISRRRRADVQMWTAEDGDLSPPRRGLSYGRVEGGGRSHVAGRGANSVSFENHRARSFSAHRDGCAAAARPSRQLHPVTNLSTLERRPRLLAVREDQRGESPPAVLVKRPNVKATRAAGGTGNAPARLPGSCGGSGTEPLEGRSCLTANAPGHRCGGNNSSSEDEAATIRKGEHVTVREGTRRLRTTEGLTSLERTRRGSRDRANGNSTNGATSGKTDRRGDGSPSPRKVVYRDRQGRVITEEEWLELKDPVSRRRRHERFDKERLPPVKLAWGGGLVQQVEKAQLAAEEAVLGQQPLARYELDEDFDLALQRKQRWDDPMAKVPVRFRSSEEGTETSFTGKADTRREDLAEGAPKRAAGQPKCPFDAPKNRFGIEPGYRWDGVVRGNGYEDRRLEAMNKRKLEEQLKHTNNVADM